MTRSPKDESETSHVEVEDNPRRSRGAVSRTPSGASQARSTGRRSKASEQAASPEKVQALREFIEKNDLSAAPRRIAEIAKRLDESASKSKLLNLNETSAKHVSSSGPLDPDKFDDLSKDISDNFAEQSRWDEARRSKKQVKLRLSPDLIEKIDQEAGAQDLTRNDWIENAIKKALTP